MIRALLLILILSGCGPSLGQLYQMDAAIAQSRGAYEFDLSETGDVGKLFIETVVPSQQLAIQKYGIKIDGGKTLEIIKGSTAEIILDSGKHNLEMFSIPLEGNLFYGEVFGRPSKKNIQIKTGETVRFRYKGPFGVMTAGSLKQLKEPVSKNGIS